MSVYSVRDGSKETIQEMDFDFDMNLEWYRQKKKVKGMFYATRYEEHLSTIYVQIILEILARQIS